MTVSISKMSIDYYLDTAAKGDGAVLGNAQDLTSYYTESGDPAGTWFGAGLQGTGIVDGQQVEKWAAKRLYEDMIDPYTGQRLGRPPIKEQQAPDGAKTPKGEDAKPTRQPVHGFDLTFSAPKSVSTLWAAADPAIQGQIHAAHKQAIAETLKWAEENIIQTRAGHGGVAHVPVTGIVGSIFDHSDSREGDPQLHSHAVIHNRVQRQSDGQWTTIDSYTLYRHVVAISERYNSLLYDRVYELAGAVAEVRDGGIDLSADTLDKALNDHDQALTELQYEPYNARIELAGIPDDLIDEFSTRSRMIEERKDELIKEWCATTGKEEPPRHIILRMRQQATLETRSTKGEVVPLDMKMTSWRERVKDMGYEPAQIVRAAVGHDAPVVTGSMLNDDMVDRLGKWVLTDAGARRTTFTRANIIAGTERILRTVRCQTSEDRELLADRIVNAALSQAVDLTPDREFDQRLGVDPAITLRDKSIFNHKEHAGLYTTHQVMDDESYLMNRVNNPAAGVTPEELENKVNEFRTSSGHALSSDQASATYNALTSHKAVDAIIGPAGTGKTTTMQAVRQLWADKYGDASVIGLAPSAVAAGVLGDEIKTPTDNTAKWIYESAGEGAARRIERIQNKQDELDKLNSKLAGSKGLKHSHLLRQIDATTTKLAADFAAQAKYTMRPNQLVIIDEASMVGTATLTELNRQAEAAGAKVLLVGDPAQLNSIDAGGFLGWMERNADVSMLDQVWRFQNEEGKPDPTYWESAASLDLRKGKEEVLKVYEEHGRIIGEKGVDAADTAYKAWITDTLQGRDSIMVGATNEQVQSLNTKAQLDLVDANRVDLSQVVSLRGEVQAGVGDVILARKNNRSLTDETGKFIANGVKIRITEIHEDGSAIGHRTDNDALISMPADYLSESVELGYATTAHRAQGVTVDTCHAIAETGVNRELFYVAMTRGKQGNYAYVNLPDEQEDAADPWDMMSKIQAEQKHEVLAGILRAETNTKTAHEIENEEHGWAKDFGRMAHEAVYLSDVAKTTRTISWVSENYGEDQLKELQASEHWTTLVRVDPAHTIKIAPESDDITVSELLLHVQEEPVTAPNFGAIVPDYAPGSAPQATLKEDLSQRMENRLDEMTRLALYENPQWVQKVKQEYPGREYEAVRIHCAWQSVSDQEDPHSEPLGTVPQRSERYMSGFYERTLKELVALKQEQHDNGPTSDQEHQQGHRRDQSNRQDETQDHGEDTDGRREQHDSRDKNQKTDQGYPQHDPYADMPDTTHEPDWPDDPYSDQPPPSEDDYGYWEGLPEEKDWNPHFQDQPHWSKDDKHLPPLPVEKAPKVETSPAGGNVLNKPDPHQHAHRPAPKHGPNVD